MVGILEGDFRVGRVSEIAGGGSVVRDWLFGERIAERDPIGSVGDFPFTAF